MKGRIKIHGLLGVALFCLAVVMLGQGREPFTTYFYAFAWWSYILVVDVLVYWVRGESLIVSKTRTFLLMIPLSIFIWCIFEGANFRLANWHYINVPHEFWWRWIGYAVSYGTVLPVLCETTHLLKAVGTFRAVSLRGLRLTPRFLQGLIVLGGLSLLAAILFPHLCFPLVWIGFALLLEPILCRRGDDSLLRDIEKGDLSGLLGLLAAGLVCGFLWELWNFWAQAKWIYTVPFFEELKLFEMPLLGFLGFPPFTVSAYALYRILLMAMGRRAIWTRGVFWFLVSLFCLLCFGGIDRYTVVSFIPLTRDLPGVQEEWKGRLQDAGIKKVQDLLRRGVPGLVHLGISHPDAVGLVRKAEMITVKGMGVENYRLLQEAGVRNLSELAQQDPRLLYLTIQEKTQLHPLPHRTPTPALVRLWVREARRGVE
ncbi:MAG: hypothetical protein A2Y65_05255 [Deltaproteobacteria bacterium RBG_13_52_11]|nr:MAG: hypothetical protein A2Y65_05255 [Deltaproteobacteria bacterium RBG_13_52_11]